MSAHSQSLGFGLMGLFFVLWTTLCLWRGQIPMRHRRIISRASEPFEFYAWVFCYSLLATLFIGAGILFWLHPGFMLHPKVDPRLDE
jgi:hypothetical protein